MHFEKLTKGTPHEPMSPMNNNTYPPWLINHQGIQPIFWRKKTEWMGGGFLIGGYVFLFVGRAPLKGGSLSELPKVSFSMIFQ